MDRDDKAILKTASCKKLKKRGTKRILVTSLRKKDAYVNN
jgi:hypothetical protein